MKTSHIVVVLAVLLVAIMGPTVYWINAFYGFTNYSGLSGSTFTVSIDSNTKWSGQYVAQRPEVVSVQPHLLSMVQWSLCMLTETNRRGILNSYNP